MLWVHLPSAAQTDATCISNSIINIIFNPYLPHYIVRIYITYRTYQNMRKKHKTNQQTSNQPAEAKMDVFGKSQEGGERLALVFLDIIEHRRHKVGEKSGVLEDGEDGDALLVICRVVLYFWTCITSLHTCIDI